MQRALILLNPYGRETVQHKLSFFVESAILIFFSKKKNASAPSKLVTNYVLEGMGLNFYYYDGLQPKISAGIINEHECTNANM